MEGIIKAVCISEKKGTKKTNVNEAELIYDFGIENDAHAGKWHRQVSLISKDKVDDFKNTYNVPIEDGAFGENLMVTNIDFKNLPIGTKFCVKESGAELILTQIGKECHEECTIKKAVGKCIMPTEGVFAKVIKGGHVKVGDTLVVIL